MKKALICLESILLVAAIIATIFFMHNHSELNNEVKALENKIQEIDTTIDSSKDELQELVDRIIELENDEYPKIYRLQLWQRRLKQLKEVY